MIRMSEMVLPGHPDKFCDQVADAVIAEAMKIDADAYAQVEVAAWSDQVWVNGGICTRRPMERPLVDIVREVGRSIGYTGGNAIDAARYQVRDAVCKEVGDPTRWSTHVNDQCIIVGWAGYDARTRYLAPEHFLAHVFREALTAACRPVCNGGGGPLAGEGPDGKLLIRLREEGERWQLEHVLVTLQQRGSTAFLDLCASINAVLADAYAAVQAADGRWRAPWREVELLVNPNGPLLNGGSDGDNGQTGRKLVMDYYGPRVPIGGGALSGKHLSHIDRVGAYAARDAAIRAVQGGAEECLVRVAYAPNMADPLEVSWEMTGRGERVPKEFFRHDAMIRRYGAAAIGPALACGRHFYDERLPWNRGGLGDGRGRVAPAEQVCRATAVKLTA